MYARAKEAMAERWADEMVGISDDTSEDPQSRRVKIDTRKWLLSKLLPKKYGEKIEIDTENRHTITVQIGGSDA